MLVTWGSCALTQIYRYIKVYTPRERQQTKWVVFGLVIGISLNYLSGLLPVIWPELNTPGSLYRMTQIVWLALFWIPIPLGVGIAILRSRLYDIDVIIRRTVIYGLLTAILAGVYAGGVIGGQRALLAITGVNASDTPVIVVLSTLAVAALFQPLRRWIQTAIDRRFYRQAYDARQTLERFSAGLREEVDLPALRERLTQVVEETVQPCISHSGYARPRPTRRVEIAPQSPTRQHRHSCRVRALVWTVYLSRTSCVVGFECEGLSLWRHGSGACLCSVNPAYPR